MPTQTKRRRAANALLLIAFVAAAVFCAYHHENWLDEAQTWLLARDLSPIALIRQMSYEGHPCLWHFLEMPLARLGLPFFTANLLSIAFATLGMALLLRLSPMPLWMICAIMFGGITLYFFAAISRSYCLIPLILFWIAYRYKNRHEQPFRYCLPIALLVQTHLIMIPMSAALSLFYMGESIARRGKDLRRKAFALCLPLLSAILFALQVINVGNSAAFQIKELSFGKALYGYYQGYSRMFTSNLIFAKYILGGSVAGFVALCAFGCVYSIIKKRDWERGKALLIVFITLFGQISINVFVFQAIYQRLLIAFFLVIWFVWVTWDSAPIRFHRHAVALMCAYCFYNMLLLSNAIIDIEGKYSDSKYIAAYIDENIADDALIFQSEPGRVASILPYLKSRNTFYALLRGTPESFVTWDNITPAYTSYEQVCKWARELNPDCNEFYYLNAQTSPMFDGMEEHGTIVYQTQEPCIIEESYVLYRCPILSE